MNFLLPDGFLDEKYGMGSIMCMSLLYVLSAMAFCVSRAGRSIHISGKLVLADS